MGNSVNLYTHLLQGFSADLERGSAMLTNFLESLDWPAGSLLVRAADMSDQHVVASKQAGLC